MPYTNLNKDCRLALENLTKKVFETPRIKTVQGKPLSGCMLLNLAMEYVESLNKNVAPVISSSFERVVQIESERFVEQLYDEAIQKIHQRFDFAQIEDPDQTFANLDTIYTTHELEEWFEGLIDDCD